MSFIGSLLGVVLLGGTFILLFLTRYRKEDNVPFGKSPYRFPPSPPTNSIMGHILPNKNSFLTHAAWIRQYGPLISLRAGTDRYVVIGSHKAAMDIMERRGGATVDRPRLVAAGELLGRNLRLLLTPPGERFKRMRKALHTHLQPKAARSYESMQMLHAKRTIMYLLESPERYQEHLSTFSVSVILKLAYGKSTSTDMSNSDVEAIQKSFRRFLKVLNNGPYLVDSLPWLKYIPWYGQDLRKGFTEDSNLFHRQLNAVKSRMNGPNSGPSFAEFLLSREIDIGLSETEMAFLAGSLFGAGSDSTTTVICAVLTAAAGHPDVQASIHAELDAVVGNGRLPTFDDERSLPVFRAYILEALRWRPFVPLGTPHRTTEKVCWEGYCIPAGTTVHGHHWAISRDPEAFPDPDTFDLTRWLTSDGKVREDLKFPHFGFGRRVCPGQHVAIRSIYISTVLILWSFRLSVDYSKPFDDMAFLYTPPPGVTPVSLRFEPRISKETLKAMLEEDIVV